jgi:hypothetical protein
MDAWPVPKTKLTRRAALSLFSKSLLACPLLNIALLDVSCSGSRNAGETQAPLSDDQFLDQMEQAAFQFYWERAGANSGQVMDRAYASGAADSRTLSSISATGFGLAALCIGAQRGYMPASQIQSRVLTTLNFIWTQLAQQNGFFYHFVDMNTGQRANQSEVSSIDTAILLCGVLTCRQFFQDAEIQSVAAQIYERVNWPWMLNGGTTFSEGWTPEGGFLNARYDTYCELMMLYLLAIGSTTFPVPASSWNAFSRPLVTYQNYTYISGNDPLFTHQYSHAWFDFRNKQDAYANYFNNSTTATEAHKAFCLSIAGQFADYSNNLWGITASDSINGYAIWGGPPSMGPIDGSIVPCAAGGSLPFDFSNCIAVLRNIWATYPAAWQRYSFVDAFNPLTNWYDTDTLGIDLGITMLMAENYRSSFVWNTFMKNPEAQAAMTAVGFK